MKRAYSQNTVQAALLLGRLVKLGRKRRGWSESELARRAGVARETVQRLEKGDLTCALGLVFEAATLVGVPLFTDDASRLAEVRRHSDEVLSLLPRRMRGAGPEVDDDF